MLRSNSWLNKWFNSKFKGAEIFQKDLIFCISIQRTGTTSIGDFFQNFGYKVARWNDSWKNQWSELWYQGDFESIFFSEEFKKYQVFEDDPWWLPEFYKVLFHRFPNSKFILFTRDSDTWFKSMVSHSKGRSLGNTKLHSKIYRREEEFIKLIKSNPSLTNSKPEIDNLLGLQGKEDHYKRLYEIRNFEVISFFHHQNMDRFFHAKLEDSDKWVRLAKFLDIEIPKNYSVHSNKSND